MSRETKYDRIAEPKLQRFQDSVTRGLNAITDSPTFPLGKPVIVKEEYRAHFGELLLIDNTGGAFTIFLPKISLQDIGKTIAMSIAYNNATTITVDGTDANIRGSATATLAAAWTWKMFIALRTDMWGYIS